MFPPTTKTHFVWTVNHYFLFLVLIRYNMKISVSFRKKYNKTSSLDSWSKQLSCWHQLSLHILSQILLGKTAEYAKVTQPKSEKSKLIQRILVMVDYLGFWGTREPNNSRLHRQCITCNSSSSSLRESGRRGQRERSLRRPSASSLLSKKERRERALRSQMLQPNYWSTRRRW